MELKNPFALKDNRIITIADLTTNERGRKCGCICPECASHFIAVMGQVRQPHFRHDGEPCDSVKALMTSLYRLLCEAIEDEHRFTFPDCYILYMGVHPRSSATLEEIIDSSQEMTSNYEDADLVIKGRAFTVESCEVHKNTKGIPDAVVLTDSLKHHQLAVMLVPPPTFCKIPEPKAFKDIPSIAIYMDDEVDIHHIKSDELKKQLRDTNDYKEWISSPAIDDWYKHLLEKQHFQHQKYLVDEAAKKKEQEARYAAEMKRQREFYAQHPTQLHHAAPVKQPQPAAVVREPEDTLKEISDKLKAKYTIIPDEIVRDDRGLRWCICDECGIWKPDVAMAMYGGMGDKVNRGLCSACARKMSQSKE